MRDENQEEPKNPWDDIIHYEFDSARRKEEIFKATLEYFRRNEKAQQYFQNFQQVNLQRTLESYAWQKAGWLVRKDYDEHWHEYRLLQTKNKAEECLANIQQKKLFTRQCEWRAEQFSHPAIETSYDFMYWEYNVLNCPFIEPITNDDVELYIEFMRNYFGENLAFLGRWQDYDTYCTNRITVIGEMHKQEAEEADEDAEEDEDDYEENEEEGDMLNETGEQTGRLMPPWYLFWDERRGAGNYRLLTDVRKPKELVYVRLAHAEKQEKWKEQLKTNPPDTRPFLNLYGSEKVLPFIEEFENPAERAEVLKAYETHQKIYHDEDEEETMYWVKEAWDDLQDCYESFPIAPGITDWKEALIATAKKWEHEKLIRMIPVVYDEYVFRMETGIEHPYDNKQAAHYRKFADEYKADILRGREMKGEPKDLNF